MASTVAEAQAPLRTARLGSQLAHAAAPGDSILLTLGGDTTSVGVGAGIVVPVVLDVNKSPGRNVAHFEGDLQWDPVRLRLDSAIAARFSPATVDLTNATTGIAGMSLTSPAGSAKQITIATFYFTAQATVGLTFVTPRALLAVDQHEKNLLETFLNIPLGVCIRTGPTLFGDANADNSVNVVDAQQIGRFGIGLSVAKPQAVLDNGDVNSDGHVDVIDAQQIARYSIGLNAAARIATRPPSPCAAP